jgi:hypothetical protein
MHRQRFVAETVARRGASAGTLCHAWLAVGAVVEPILALALHHLVEVRIRSGNLLRLLPLFGAPSWQTALETLWRV